MNTSVSVVKKTAETTHAMANDICRDSKTLNSVFCCLHTAVSHAALGRKRVWHRRHAELNNWWVHGIFQKKVSWNSHLTQTAYFRDALCWFHAKHWPRSASLRWARRGRSTCFDQFNQMAGMTISLGNRQAHADHAQAHDFSVTCTTPQSQIKLTPIKRRKKGSVWC